MQRTATDIVKTKHKTARDSSRAALPKPSPRSVFVVLCVLRDSAVNASYAIRPASYDRVPQTISPRWFSFLTASFFFSAAARLSVVVALTTT